MASIADLRVTRLRMLHTNIFVTIIYYFYFYGRWWETLVPFLRLIAINLRP